MNGVCQLCGHGSCETVSELDRHGKPLRTVLCLGCGSVTNDPIPSEEELAAFYRSDYRRAYKGAAEPRMRQVWRNFSRIAQHLRDNAEFYRPGARCLDLGSGSGEFAYLAGRIGMDCVGVEPNEPYAAYSRDRLGLNVLNQSLEDSRFPDASFDLIRLSHVLEHMRAPVRSLATLREWLAPDGLIYIEVPNILEEAGRKVKGRIFHYGHIFNFSPRTLRNAAALAGLVEHPASAARYGDRTCGFFARGEAISQAEAVDRDNAARVGAALKSHGEHYLPADRGTGAALAAGAATLAARLSEVVAARRFSSPRAIGDHFARRIAGAGQP